MQASDDSNGKLTWTLINETMFSLDSNRLILNGTLDYEGTFIYQLHAFVRNEKGFSDTATITVQVTNVNEAPVFTAAPDTLSEADGLESGTVLDTLKASDPDGDIFVFFIRSGNADNMFGLTSEGVLKLTGTLDYATTPVYNLVVAVTDGSDTVSTSLTIVVDTSRFVDARDGHVYKKVKIGSQTWMAQNLNYVVDSSWCYDGSADSCSKYGRLYQWAAAMGASASYNSAYFGDSVNRQGVCPAGWHVPRSSEWTTLEDAVGGSSVAGTKLKSTSGWDEGGNGTDAYGFSALPAGSRYDYGDFLNVGRNADFWSATEYAAGLAYGRYLVYNGEYMGTDDDIKGTAFSVRCVKDL